MLCPIPCTFIITCSFLFVPLLLFLLLFIVIICWGILCFYEVVRVKTDEKCQERDQGLVAWGIYTHMTAQLPRRPLPILLNLPVLFWSVNVSPCSLIGTNENKFQQLLLRLVLLPVNVLTIPRIPECFWPCTDVMFFSRLTLIELMNNSTCLKVNTGSLYTPPLLQLPWLIHHYPENCKHSNSQMFSENQFSKNW